MKASIWKKESFLVFLLLFGLAGYAPSYGQDGKYTLYELGTLGGPASKAFDINDSGQIVGVADTELNDDGGTIWQVFIGTKDGISKLFPGETVRSSANAINRGGTVAGYKNGNAFIVGGGSPFIDFGLLPGATPGEGLGLNNGQKVVGYSSGDEIPEMGSLWEKNGDIYLKRNLGTFGGLYTRATSVNDSNQIVGHSQTSESVNRAFRWNSTGAEPMTDLGALADFSQSFAFRINNRGAVAGYSLRYDGYDPTARACLWGESGIQELKKKNASRVSESVLYSEAYGINDSGFVVGMYWSGEHQELRAFIWDAVNEMRDLNSLLPENPGLLLVAAYAINNKGEIVGYGYKGGSTSATAFLLVPPPGNVPADEPFQVDIDIHPWNSQNKIHKQAWWYLIQIAVLSDTGFDAPKVVDRESLTFGRTGNEDSLAFCMPWKTDVNRDRKKDLICYFYEKPTGFKCGDILGTLKGKTLTGEAFGGQDKVQIFPCPTPRKDHKGK